MYEYYIQALYTLSVCKDSFLSLGQTTDTCCLGFINMYYCIYVCISSEFVENCTHHSPWGRPILRAYVLQYNAIWSSFLSWNSTGLRRKHRTNFRNWSVFQRFYMKFRQILSNFSWILGNFQVIFHFSLMIFYSLLSHRRDLTTFCPSLDSY